MAWAALTVPTKRTTIFTLSIFTFILFAVSFFASPINSRAIDESYSVGVRGVSVREFSTNASESSLSNSSALYTVAYWSCTIPSPINITTQTSRAIYCQVFALGSDNVVATLNGRTSNLEVQSVTNLGDAGGFVLIHIKNDNASGPPASWGGDPRDKLSIIVFTANPVTGRPSLP
jgi:hypothetical protein